MSDSQKKWQEEGATIQRMREATGLSRAQFSARIGVSAVTLRNAENGLHRLGARTFAKAQGVYQALTGASPAPAQASPSPDVCEAPVAYGCHADMIAQAVRLARNPGLLDAVARLAEAAGISEEDLIAEVARLSTRPKR